MPAIAITSVDDDEDTPPHMLDPMDIPPDVIDRPVGVYKRKLR